MTPDQQRAELVRNIVAANGKMEPWIERTCARMPEHDVATALALHQSMRASIHVVEHRVEWS